MKQAPYRWTAWAEPVDRNPADTVAGKAADMDSAGRIADQAADMDFADMAADQAVGTGFADMAIVLEDIAPPAVLVDPASVAGSGFADPVPASDMDSDSVPAPDLNIAEIVAAPGNSAVWADSPVHFEADPEKSGLNHSRNLGLYVRPCRNPLNLFFVSWAFPHLAACLHKLSQHRNLIPVLIIAENRGD